MKIHKFKFGDKVYHAAFNLNALEKMAEIAGPDEKGNGLDVNQLLQLFSSQRGLLKGLLILLREGEALGGPAVDIDEAWLSANLSPAEHMWIQHKLAAIYVEGMRMETAMDEDEEVDEVLEQLKKKLLKGDAPSDSSKPGDSPAE